VFIVQLASVKMLPWAKANINPTGQALIISTGANYCTHLILCISIVFCFFN
jgi:hypothetical protein